jgi:MATE family multidrug resistance protein
MLGVDDRSEARHLIALAWPITLTNLQWILLNLTDTALVGQHSTLALGHLSAGRVVTYVAIVMGIAMLSGILVFAARAHGARDLPAAGRVLGQGLAFALVLAAASATALLVLAGALMVWAGVSPELRAGGAAYVRAMALAYPAQFLFMAASYWLEGISRPRPAMWINLATLPLNALLSWLLIHGHGPWPALGATGAALGTGLSVTAAAVAILVYLARMPDAGAFGVRRALGLAALLEGWRDGAPLRRFGVMPGIAGGLELAGFSVLVALSTGFGAAPAGGFQTAIAFHNLSLAAALGLGSAAGVRVGNAMGAGEAHLARRRGLIAALLALGTLMVFALLFWLGAPWLAPLVSSDPAVVALGAAMLARLALFLPFDGIQLVFLFALRALGDQVAAGALSITSFFLLSGGAGWWLVRRAGAGPMALVDALILGMVAAAVLLGGRFLWKTRAVAAAPAGEAASRMANGKR